MKVRTLDRDELVKHGFTPEKEAKQLNLFFEDFGNNSAWHEICDVLGYDPRSTSEITIAYVGTHD